MNADIITILSIAFLWSFLFLVCVFLEKTGKIKNFSIFISKVYRGYHNNSISGIFTGFSWAVLDGLITGIIIDLIMKNFN
jgi:hypothetical protein